VLGGDVPDDRTAIPRRNLVDVGRPPTRQGTCRNGPHGQGHAKEQTMTMPASPPVTTETARRIAARHGVLPTFDDGIVKLRPRLPTGLLYTEGPAPWQNTLRLRWER